MNPPEICRWALAVLSGALLALWPSLAPAWDLGDGLRLRARVQTRWLVERDTQDESWSDRLSLRRARLDARWEKDWLRLEVELDAADKVAAKDVYARVKLARWLRLTAGQFKKPFSRLQLTSPFELPIPERGLLDRFAVDGTWYGGFGARDLGVMASGEIVKSLHLRYFIGAFNNSLDKARYHRDYLARLEIRPLPGLAFGVNLSHKRYDEYDTDQVLVTGRTKNLLGADLSFSAGGLRLDLEGAYGDNAGASDTTVTAVASGYGHALWGAHLIVSYRQKIGDQLTLVPAFMAEAFDPSLTHPGDTAIRLAGALNADVGARLRVTLAGEGLLSHAAAFRWPATFLLQLQAML